MTLKTPDVIYAHPAAGNAVMLTWDRGGRFHVATIFDKRKLGETFSASDGWQRREFPVVRLDQ